MSSNVGYSSTTNNNVQPALAKSIWSPKVIGIVVASVVGLIIIVGGGAIWYSQQESKPNLAPQQPGGQRNSQGTTETSGGGAMDSDKKMLDDLSKLNDIGQLSKEQEQWIQTKNLDKLNLPKNQIKKAKDLKQNVVLRKEALDATKDKGKGADLALLPRYEEALTKKKELALTTKEAKALENVITKLKRQESNISMKAAHERFIKAWTNLTTDKEEEEEEGDEEKKKENHAKLIRDAQGAFDLAKKVFKESSNKDKSNKEYQRRYGSDISFSQFASKALIDDINKMIKEQKKSNKRPKDADSKMNLLQEFLEDDHEFKDKTYDQVFTIYKDKVIVLMEDLHKNYTKALREFLAHPNITENWEAVQVAWKAARDKLDEPDQATELENVEYQRAYLQPPKAKTFEEFYFDTAKNDFETLLRSHLNSSIIDPNLQPKTIKALEVLNNFSKSPFSKKSLADIEQLNREYCTIQDIAVKALQDDLVALVDIDDVKSKAKKLLTQRNDFLFNPVCAEKLPTVDNESELLLHVANPKQEKIKEAFETKLKDVLIKQLPLNKANLRKLIDWHSCMSSKVLPELVDTEADFKTHGRTLAVQEYKSILQAAALAADKDPDLKDSKIKEAYDFIANIVKAENLGDKELEDPFVASASKSLQATTDYFNTRAKTAANLDVLDFADWERRIQKAFAPQMPFYYTYERIGDYGMSFEVSELNLILSSSFEDVVCNPGRYGISSEDLACLWAKPSSVDELESLNCFKDNDGPLLFLFGDEYLKYRSPVAVDRSSDNKASVSSSESLKKIIDIYQPYLLRERFYKEVDFENPDRSFRMALWIIRIQQAISYTIRSLSYPYEREPFIISYIACDKHQKILSLRVNLVLKFVQDALSFLDKAKKDFLSKMASISVEPPQSAKLIYRLFCTPLSEELAQLTIPLPESQNPSKDVVDILKIFPHYLFQSAPDSSAESTNKSTLKSEQDIIDTLNKYFNKNDRLAPLAGHLKFLNQLFQELIKACNETDQLTAAKADHVFYMMNPQFFYDEIVHIEKNGRLSSDPTFFVASLIHGLPELYDWYLKKYEYLVQKFMRPFSGNEIVRAGYDESVDGPKGTKFMSVSNAPGLYPTTIPKSTLPVLQDLRTPNSRHLIRCIYQNFMDFSESPYSPNDLDNHERTLYVTRAARKSTYQNVTMGLTGYKSRHELGTLACDNSVTNCGVFSTYFEYFVKLLFAPPPDPTDPKPGLQIFWTHVGKFLPSLEASPKIGRLAGFTLGRLWQHSKTLEFDILPEWLHLAMDLDNEITQETFVDFVKGTDKCPEIMVYKEIQGHYDPNSKAHYRFISEGLIENFTLIDRLTLFKRENQRVFDNDNSLLKVTEVEYQKIALEEYFYRFKYCALSFREGVHELLKYAPYDDIDERRKKRELVNADSILANVLIKPEPIDGSQLAEHIEFPFCDDERVTTESGQTVKLEKAFRDHIRSLGGSEKDQNLLKGYLIMTYNVSRLPIGGYDSLNVKVYCVQPDPIKHHHRNGPFDIKSCDHSMFCYGYDTMKDLVDSLDFIMDTSFHNPDTLTDTQHDVTIIGGQIAP